jgi:hypothetical protein
MFVCYGPVHLTVHCFLLTVKTLLQHIALAHRDWLPSGVLPASHFQGIQATLHNLIGAVLQGLIFCLNVDTGIL